jgi:hypothetical protein
MVMEAGMSETVLDVGTIKLTGEAIQFTPVKDEPTAEGRIPVAAIARIRRKRLFAPLFWPVAATLSAELFAFFLALSNTEPLTRAALRDYLIEFGNRHGLDTAPYFQRFYDDHHLFLISMGFLALTLLPLLVAALIRKNRLVLRLTVPAKPAIVDVTIAAGAHREALVEAIGKLIAAR